MASSPSAFCTARPQQSVFSKTESFQEHDFQVRLQYHGVAAQAKKSPHLELVPERIVWPLIGYRLGLSTWVVLQQLDLQMPGIHYILNVLDPPAKKIHQVAAIHPVYEAKKGTNPNHKEYHCQWSHRSVWLLVHLFKFSDTCTIEQSPKHKVDKRKFWGCASTLLCPIEANGTNFAYRIAMIDFYIALKRFKNWPAAIWKNHLRKPIWVHNMQKWHVFFFKSDWWMGCSWFNQCIIPY